MHTPLHFIHINSSVIIAQMQTFLSQSMLKYNSSKFRSVKLKAFNYLRLAWKIDKLNIDYQFNGNYCKEWKDKSIQIVLKWKHYKPIYLFWILANQNLLIMRRHSILGFMGWLMSKLMHWKIVSLWIFMELLSVQKRIPFWMAIIIALNVLKDKSMIFLSRNALAALKTVNLTQNNVSAAQKSCN